MSGFYDLTEGTQEHRQQILRDIPLLSQLPADLQAASVTAWATAWLSTSYGALSDMPYSLQAPDYALLDHVNEVGEVGLLLAEYACSRWDVEVQLDLLLASLLLHDIDKALLYQGVRGDEVHLAPTRSLLPHGVLGAMLLKEVGLPDEVIATVGTHATTSPLKTGSTEAWILHYADLFACDHAFGRAAGTIPFYQRVGA